MSERSIVLDWNSEKRFNMADVTDAGVLTTAPDLLDRQGVAAGTRVRDLMRHCPVPIFSYTSS